MARGGVSIPIERNPAGVPTTRQDVARQASGAGAQSARSINNLPRQGQVTIYDQRFVVGTNTIVIHGLGRQPKGYALVNIRPDPTQAAATSTQGAQRNLTADDSKTISLGPFQPFLADVEVWG